MGDPAYPVGMRPPSIAKPAPVMFVARSLARAPISWSAQELCVYSATQATVMVSIG